MTKRKRSRHRANKRNPGSFLSAAADAYENMFLDIANSMAKELFAENPFVKLYQDTQLYGAGAINTVPLVYGSLGSELPDVKPQGINSTAAIQFELNRLRATIVENQKLLSVPRLFVHNPELCEHTFANYVGLTESYSYCTKCDKKDTGL